MRYDYHSVPGIIQPPPPGALLCSFRVHDEQDNRIATCWVEGNAKRIVDALNTQASLRSRVEALESVVLGLMAAGDFCIGNYSPMRFVEWLDAKGEAHKLLAPPANEATGTATAGKESV